MSGFAIVTPTYRNDFKLAQRLCASIDRHVDPAIVHHVVVPKRDAALFAALANDRRQIVLKDAVLRPSGFRRLPLPDRIAIPFARPRPIREQWLDHRFRRVSGWIVQQLVKLACTDYVHAENIMLIDSDVVLIRRFDPGDWLRDGSLPLQKLAEPVDLPTHRAWRARAGQIMGLDPAAIAPDSYIGSINFWKRSNLLKLKAFIETRHRRNWLRILAEDQNLSEYILYGLFCEHVLGQDSGQYATDLKICRTLWNDSPSSIDSFKTTNIKDIFAVHVQSFLDTESLRSYFEEIFAHE